MSGFYLICFGISFFIFVYASFLFIFEKIKKNKKAVAVPQNVRRNKFFGCSSRFFISFVCVECHIFCYARHSFCLFCMAFQKKERAGL
jgi:hypothetical protein